MGKYILSFVYLELKGAQSEVPHFKPLAIIRSKNLRILYALFPSNNEKSLNNDYKKVGKYVQLDKESYFFS